MVRECRCDCGEALIDHSGRCGLCRARRVLPKELHIKRQAVDQAICDLDTAVVEWLRNNTKDRPKAAIVCICGSTRFRAEIAEVNRQLTLEGKIVLAPGVFTHDGDALTGEDKERLDRLHLEKIDLADEVVVVNPGGYIGESTCKEIDYAMRCRKRITYVPSPSLIVGAQRKHRLYGLCTIVDPRPGSDLVTVRWPRTDYPSDVRKDELGEMDDQAPPQKITNPAVPSQSWETNS